MIGIIDYGAGNLFSVQNALNHLEIENCIVKEEAGICSADALILPGVGAFPDAMKMLKQRNLDAVICKEAKKKPLLGICLGMQLLFESSCEFQETDGLGLIPGKVVKIESQGLKIPHMGWNNLTVLNSCEITERMPEDVYVYFVHSFRADTEDDNISCYTVYGEKIPALVHRGMVYGAQFHPEKAGKQG